MQPLKSATILTKPQIPAAAMWGSRLALLALFVLLTAGLSFADGNQHKLSKDLEALKNGPKGATVDVIIQFKHVPTEEHRKKVREKGGIHKKDLHLIKGDLFSVPVKMLDELAQDPEIVYISPDRAVGKTLDHVDMVTNADLAWSQGFDGSGVGVAVIDSGIDQLPDLNSSDQSVSRVVYSESFVSGDPSTNDQYGHGTHVAGIVGGNGYASIAQYRAVYRGIAPNASIVNLRVLDQNGTGNDSNVILAIDRAIALQSTYNIRVLNLSLGRGIYESYALDPMDQAVEAAWNAGIVVVVAAGNSGRDNSLGTHGYGTISVPGNDPYVITVGAANMHNQFTQAAQTVASYSSKGPTLIDHFVKPDLIAPGNRVVSLLAPGSTIPTLYPQFDICPSTGCAPAPGSTSSYLRLSGTSMATPVVSGAVALLLQQNAGLTPDQVKARLMKTAYKGYAQYGAAQDVVGNVYSLQSDVFAAGAGFLDIAAALANTDLAPSTAGSAESPQVGYNSATNTLNVIPNSSEIWDSSVVWGSAVVWGDAISGTDISTGWAVVWGSSLVWGTSTNQGLCVVWGTSVIWGTADFQALSDSDDGDIDIQ